MLQNIRDRFTGVFALVLLMLLGFSFIFFGINLPFMGGAFAAKVEGVEIPMQQFENAYQSELSRFAQMGGELRLMPPDGGGATFELRLRLASPPAD